jgi:hypothetical protein
LDTSERKNKPTEDFKDAAHASSALHERTQVLNKTKHFETAHLKTNTNLSETFGSSMSEGRYYKTKPNDRGK